MQLIKVCTQVLNQLQAIKTSETNGAKLATLKAALSDVSELARTELSGYQVEIPLGKEPTIEWRAYSACRCAADVNKNRNKADWLAALDVAIEELSAYVFVLPESQDPLPLVTRLQEIEKEIPELISSAANAYLQVGALLIEARDDFETQASFLEWALTKFSIKKSQVFRLMKISKEFGEDERFEGVAMRVLDALSGESEAIKTAAAELAAAGKLDTPALQLLQGGKAEPEAPALPEVPVDTKAVNLAPVVITETPVSEDGDSERIQSLLLTINNLVKRQDELLSQLAQLQKPKAQTLPMLPHFKSASLHTRLGVAITASPKELRAAYREITKHYTPEANKEAFDLLTAALGALLQEVAA